MVDKHLIVLDIEGTYIKLGIIKPNESFFKKSYKLFKIYSSKNIKHILNIFFLLYNKFLLSKTKLKRN